MDVQHCVGKILALENEESRTEVSASQLASRR